MSQCVLPWVSVVSDSLCFLDLNECFLSHVREVFRYNLFKYSLRPFLSLFSFWYTYNVNVGAFNVVPETVLISFHILFSLFCSIAVISTILSPSSLIHSASLFCIDSFCVFFTPVIVLFICVCLFFKSPSSLLNIYCNILVCTSILFPRSWIIFIIITLNSFSCRLPISSSFSCSCGFYLIPSSDAYFSAISFYLTFCVCGLLSTGWRIIALPASGVCPRG